MIGGAPGETADTVVAVTDDGYPALLHYLAVPPARLWIRGEPRAMDLPGVAIVGSRRCSQRGATIACWFARDLAAAGMAIVSGGARGIDAAAHRGALAAGGITIAVLGTGLDRVYPPEHGNLFASIIHGGGALVSEFAPEVGPAAAHFPRRNRIIAALSCVVLVVEAARRSGALITARIAVEDLGRDCLGVPGALDNAASRGVHHAIGQGWMGLVDDPRDVLEVVRDAWPRVMRSVSSAASRP